MDRFNAQEVPTRDEFITKMKEASQIFYQEISSLSSVKADVIQNFKEFTDMWEKSGEFTVDNIHVIERSLKGTWDSGLTEDQKKRYESIRVYIRAYVDSQKIVTSGVYMKDKLSQVDYFLFCEDVLDLLGLLYDNADEATNFSKNLLPCVKIFWNYDRKWISKQDVTEVTMTQIRELNSHLQKVTGHEDGVVLPNNVAVYIITLKSYVADA